VCDEATLAHIHTEGKWLPDFDLGAGEEKYMIFSSIWRLFALNFVPLPIKG
jgi:hypothetical protein